MSQVTRSATSSWRRDGCRGGDARGRPRFREPDRQPPGLGDGDRTAAPSARGGAGTRRPLSASSAARVSIPAKAPWVYTLSKANVVRSNSRIAGCSAAPDTTGTSGSASRERGDGLLFVQRVAKRPEERDGERLDLLAVDELTRAAATTSAGSSGRTTLPSRSMRSSTPTTQREDTISGGGVSQPSSSCTRRPRANDTSSSKPFVVISPTFRPTREASTLVTAVVPRPNRRTAGSTDVTSRPARVAASSIAATTPRPTSPGVVGDFARQMPDPSVSTASVKVPPTSTPRHTSPVRSIMRGR